MAKIDTPFWQRNPFFLTDFQWGLVYSIHGFFALGMITFLIILVYFALRPHKRFLLRSMTRGEYLAEHDPVRWMPDSPDDRQT